MNTTRPMNLRLGTLSKKDASYLPALVSSLGSNRSLAFLVNASSQPRSLLSCLSSCHGGPLIRPMQTALVSSATRRGVVATQALVSAPLARPADAKFVTEAHGFKLQRQQFVSEYDAMVLLYKHDKTGAEVISVMNNDENKTFGVVFRTPVDNSYGIPHILEHSVLCGSRKYPIKEPFVELMKGSLNTFLNAFTYPDRTCYPVASTNIQDFYNLVDVYMDAVFHPRCISDPKVFEQEGWHYELDSLEDEMTYKGVVFNEMKGVYSSPDSVYYRTVQQSLFPENTYRHDSGGDPLQIPGLKFDEFKDFHSKYYHPSNARFWFYGDDDVTKRLEILDKYLTEFELKQVTSAVVTQPLIPKPRKVVQYYAVGEEEGEEGGKQKAFVGINWILTDKPLDVETELTLGFLDYLMLGTNAAPLRKALNDSSLGEAVIGGGIDDELKQPIFGLGLKGVDPADVEKVEALILSKLQELAEGPGFSPGAIEAAVNSIEFSLRENNTGSFPRGLSLMLRSMNAWIYDRDPFQPIQWEEALGNFKTKLASGQDVFGPLIKKYILENQHRVVVHLLPDSELSHKMEAEEKERIEAFRKTLTSEQVGAIIANTAELKRLQETPDPPEALKCIPTLQLSDIPRLITKVPTDVTQLSGSGATLLTHDLFTNNILYMETAFDMKTIPGHLLPLVPLFCRSLTQMGTAKENFIELTERIGRKTGGFSISTMTSPVRGRSDSPVAKVMIRGKAMASKAGDLFDVARDVLLTAQLNDKARFTQMVSETKSGMESGIIGSGHSYAARRLGAQHGGVAGWMSEQMGGISYLEYIRTLAKRVESDWEGVQADLENIRSALLQSQGTLINLTGDSKTLQLASPHVTSFLSSLPKQTKATSVPWQASYLPRVNEAFTVPTQVNYVGKGGNLYSDAGYKLNGSAYVIEKYLGNTWLWDRVRVVGGAYGGFCSFDPQSGNFTFLSYRDPNLTETLDVYDGSVEFLRSLNLDQDALTKSIVGTMGDIDAYQLPDAKGSSALSRYLLGMTDEERQQRRDEILGTTNQDFKAFAEVIASISGDKGRVVAVTSADKAKAVLEQKPDFWTVNKIV